MWPQLSGPDPTPMRALRASTEQVEEPMRKYRFLAPAMVLVLTLAACGDGDEPGASGGGAARCKWGAQDIACML